MNIIRGLARFLCTSLLGSLVLLLPLLASLAIVLRGPEPLQDTLRDSGVYDSLVGGVLASSSQQAGQQGADASMQALLRDPQFEKVIQQALPPQTLIKASDTITSGVFAWLDGKTAQPEFSIDLTANRQLLLDGLTNYAKQRIASLPVCNQAEAAALAAQPLNPLSIPCAPPGIDIDTVARQFGSETLASSGLLKNPVIDQTILPKDENGQPLSEKLANAPKIYQWLAWAPWLVGAAIVLLMLAIVLLSTPHARGLRVVSRALFSSGAVLLVGALLYLFFFNNLAERFGASGLDQELQQSIRNVFSGLLGRYAIITAIIAGGYMVLGALLLIIERRTRRNPTTTK